MHDYILRLNVPVHYFLGVAVCDALKQRMKQKCYLLLSELWLSLVLLDNELEEIRAIAEFCNNHEVLLVFCFAYKTQHSRVIQFFQYC